MAIKLKENLKTIRKAYGLAQREMAERLEVPEKRYQSYEEGRGEPRLSEIYRFCCITNLTMEELLIVNLEANFTPLKINQLALKKPKTLIKVGKEADTAVISIQKDF